MPILQGGEGRTGRNAHRTGGDRLTIKLKDELLSERRLMDISQVSPFDSVILSAQALRELTTRGIPVCHFTYGGWFHGITTGLVHKNVELRIRQFEIAASAEQSLRIARWFISGKIRNCRTMLRRHRSISGESLQYSVFRCELSREERQKLIESLWEILNLAQDRLLVANLGLSDSRGIDSLQYWGVPREEPNSTREVIL